MRPSDERFREVFDTLEPYIERRYGVPVIIKDVPDPFTGDLDGTEIHVDYANDVESAVFIIAHLFGQFQQTFLIFAKHFDGDLGINARDQFVIAGLNNLRKVKFDSRESLDRVISLHRWVIRARRSPVRRRPGRTRSRNRCRSRHSAGGGGGGRRFPAGEPTRSGCRRRASRWRGRRR